MVFVVPPTVNGVYIAKLSLSEHANCKPFVSLCCYANEKDNSTFGLCFCTEIEILQERKLLQRNLCSQNYCGSQSRRPCGVIKKVHWLFLYVCNCKFVVFWVFWVLCCEITCKWGLFPGINACFCWPA